MKELGLDSAGVSLNGLAGALTGPADEDAGKR